MPSKRLVDSPKLKGRRLFTFCARGLGLELIWRLESELETFAICIYLREHIGALRCHLVREVKLSVASLVTGGGSKELKSMELKWRVGMNLN
jgi:hypothetical protein